MKIALPLSALLGVLLMVSSVSAQSVTVFGPLGAPRTTVYYPSTSTVVGYAPDTTVAPVVSYYSSSAVSVPVTSYYAPTTTYYAPTTSYYAPATTAYYAPTTAYYAPTTAYYAPATTITPVTSYYAPVTTYYSPTAYSAYYPTAVTAYSPVVTYGTPAVVGSSVYGTPRVYVPGQPVRNLLRSLAP